MKGFADRLREAREERGWTRYRLAREANIGDALVYSYENGEKTPGAANLAALAKALGVPADRLLGIDDPEAAA